MTIRRAGETGYLIDVVDRDPAQLASDLRVLAAKHGLGVVDVVPGLSSVLIDLARPTKAAEMEHILRQAELLPRRATELQERVVIDTRYDGTDLGEVAEMAGMTVEDVIELHSSTVYHAAFSGFAPGFLYLTGVPEALRVPRRPESRKRVPSGSVGLADPFTAIYPRESPGGWQLIGRTDAVLWDPAREPAALIQPGGTVRFRPVGAGC